MTSVWVPDTDHEAMRDLIRLRSVVRQIVTRARQHLQGFLLPLINAVVLVTEVGDFTRFSNPRQLMAYFGLVQGERSSGETVRRGAITKTGNSHISALVEGAWAYRMKARIGRR